MEVNYYERSCTEQAPEALLRENEFGAKKPHSEKIERSAAEKPSLLTYTFQRHYHWNHSKV